MICFLKRSVRDEGYHLVLFDHWVVTFYLQLPMQYLLCEKPQRLVGVTYLTVKTFFLI